MRVSIVLGVVLGIASSVVAPRSAVAASGALDGTFGTNGLVLTNFKITNAAANGRAVVVQSSGRIVVAGQSTNGGGAQTVFAAFHADGSVDSTFSGGIVQVQVGTTDQINGMTLDAQERIVAVGFTNVPSVHQNLLVIRLTKDGQLDSSFGVGGVVNTPIAAVAVPPANPATAVPIEFPRGVAVQSDGKIVIAGFGKNDGSITQAYRMDVLRLNSDGSLDTAFSGTGAKLITFPNSVQDRGYAVALQSDGKIVVAGDSRPGTGQPGAGSLQFALARLNTDGSLDTSFDGDGLLTTLVGGGAAHAVLIDRIAGTDYIVAGGFDGASAFEIARYTPSGALDTTFASDGTMTSMFDSSQNTGEAMVVQTTSPSNHRYVLGGEIGSSGDFGTIRVNQDGTLDTTYGASGGRRIDFGSSELAPALALQSDGKILQVGPSPTATDNVIYIARLTVDGALDATFAAPNGFKGVTGITGGSNETADAIALDPSGGGRVVLAGTIFDTTTSTDVAVARYTSAGALDTAFNGTGKVTLDLAGYGDSVGGVTVDASGRVIVVGQQGAAPNGVTPLVVLRFTAAGALDGTFGTNGKVTFAPETAGGMAYAVAVQPWDGKIVVGGTALPSLAGANHQELALVRLESNGSIDSGWNGGAFTVVGGVGVGIVRAIAFDSAHRILVAGQTSIPARSKAMVARFSTSGALDTSFGGGVVTPAFATAGNDFASGVQVDGDGRVLVGGTAGSAQWAVARYDGTGALDASWGTGGYVRTTIGAGVLDQIFAAGLQFDEKLVAYGLISNSATNGLAHWAFARYNWDDGSLDTTFATNGLFNGYSFGSGNNLPGGVAVRPGAGSGLSGQILGGGADWSAGDFAAVALTADAAPTTPATPDLAAASDSGRSTSDEVTNDTTPTFTGGCTVGQTVFLTVDGAVPSPRKRVICRTGTYQVDAPALAEGTHTIGAFTTSGYGRSADGPTLAVEIDTHADAVSITAPAANAALDAAGTVTFNGTGAELNAKGNAIVTVHEGATQICQATATSGGAWTCAVAGSSLALGSHTVGVYQTDLAGNQSGDVSRTFFVKSQTTTVVASSANPAVFGQAVSLTATIAAASGGTVSSGTATFTVDATSSAPVTVAGGLATYAPGALSVATHPVTVAYSGSNAYFASSGSLAGGQVVNPASTTTTLGSSKNPSVFGEPVTVTATVAPVAPGSGAPSGSLSFTVDGTAQPAVALVAGTNQSTVTWSSSTLGVGSHTVTAAYQGSTNHSASSGTLAGGQVVNPAATATSIAASPNPSVFGQSVTFTIAVATVSPGGGTPSGTVAVTIAGAAAAGSPFTLDGAGHATVTTSGLAVGSATITATYAGDASHDGSSASHTQTVNQANSTTTIGSHSPSPSFAGQSVTVGFSVAAQSPGAGAPGGSVTVSDDLGSATCSAALDGASSGSCALVLSAVGTHSLKAAYAGDTSFRPSLATATQVVQPAPDLTVVKTDDVAGHGHAGGTWTWTLTVANGTTSAAASFGDGQAVLTDDLPDTAGGLTYGIPVVTPGSGFTGTLTCGIVASTLRCSATGAVAIAAAGGFAVRVPVSASVGAVFANPRTGGICAVDPADAIPESDETNNGCSDTVSTETPELALTLTPGAPSTTAGAALSYVLGYVNSGTHDATGVQLGVTVPAGTAFSAAGSTGTWDCADGSGAGIVCHQAVGAVAKGGGSGSATWTVVVGTPVAAGQTAVVTTATVADDGSNGTEIDAGDNSASASTPIAGGPDLTLSASDGGTSVAPGAVVAYTLTYSNAGVRGASGVVLHATVPALAAFEPASSTPGWTCAPDAGAGSLCALGLGIVPGGGGAAVSLAVRAVDPVPAGATALALTATIADDGANGADVSPGNETGEDTTPLTGGPDLALTVGDGGISITPPGTVVYALSYTNAGHRGASGVTLTETVPAGGTFAAGASTAGWACLPDGAAGGVCTLSVGTLAGGGAAGSAAFAVSVASPAPAGVVALHDLAAIADDGANGPDANAADNGAEDTTPITAAVDLAVTVSDGKTAVLPGAPLSYAIGIANLGTRNATGVVLTETVPAHTVFDPAASAAGWTCAPDAGAGASCTLPLAGTLVGGAPATVVAFAVTVDAGAPVGTLLDDAVAARDDGSGGADAVPGNDGANDADTLVGAAPAITSADHATFRAGSAGTFAVIVTGTPAADLASGGALPAGVTFDGATGLLAGTPADGTDGVYPLVLRASNGLAPDATQSFTLTVEPEALDFWTLAPCRVLDTRTVGGALAPSEARAVTLAGACGIPTGAIAVAVNVTAVDPPAGGGLALYRADLAPAPTFDTLFFRARRTRAQNAVVRVSVDGQGRIALRNDSTGAVGVVLDVVGYFQ